MDKGKLYAVVVTNVYPKQCVVVWDNEDAAAKLAEHLSTTVSDNVEVATVDCFFPDGMCDADKTWIDASNAYLRGDHINYGH